MILCVAGKTSTTVLSTASEASLLLQASHNEGIRPSLSGKAPIAPFIQVARSMSPSFTSEMAGVRGVAVKQLATASASPRKITPHSESMTKYCVANSSSLPLSVVSQLMAKQCATVATGKKSILLIPVEKEGGKSVNLVALSPSASVTPATLASSVVTSDPVVTHASPPKNACTTTSSGSKSPHQPILPKPPLPQSIQRIPLQQGILGLQGAIVTQGVLQQRVLGGLNGSLSKLAHTASSTSPRYPSNETVRNLLDKRKSTEEKKPPYKFMKLYLNTTTAATSTTSLVSPQVSNVIAPNTTVKLNSETLLATANKNVLSPSKTLQVVMSVNSAMTSPSKPEIGVNSINKQQCVITSISPAKLNTLLLQTSAAGAKSIPALIKLPSKATLDSAVKAVVTSVNTTLPTVNIKVPSPTSLPNIGPRRNVTKTVQTMKSPIPVAPKVLTQHSGGRATLSVANSGTMSNSQYLAMPSLQNQIVQNPGSMVLGPGTSLQSQSNGKVEGTFSLAALQDHAALFPKDVSKGNSVADQNFTFSIQGLDKQVVKPVSPAAGSQSVTGQAALLNKMWPKLSPPLLLTSKGYVQVGVEGTDHNGIVTATKIDQETTPVTSITKPTPSITQTITGSQVDQTNPVIALNASGIPIGALRRSSVGQISTGGDNSKPPILQNYIMPQSASSLTTPQAPVIGQTNLMSPLIGMNLQQGLALAGGMQLASPLGLQLLQSPLAALPQNLELQTDQVTPSQLVAPLTAQVNAAGLRLLQKGNTTQIPPALNNLLTVTNASDVPVQPSSLIPQLNLGNPQMMLQYSSAGQQLAAVTSQFLHSQLSAQHVGSTDNRTLSVLKENKQTVVNTGVQKPVSIHHVQVPTGVSQQATSVGQQKLLLFSIGGQLVTGQGVPVTLDNGVLKVLPQGKVKINQQTLTQEQIKQTLAKINEAATHVTFARTVQSTSVQGANVMSNLARHTDSAANNNIVLPLMNGKAVSSTNQNHLVTFKQEPLNTVQVKPELLDTVKTRQEPVGVSAAVRGRIPYAVTNVAKPGPSGVLMAKRNVIPGPAVRWTAQLKPDNVPLRTVHPSTVQHKPVHDSVVVKSEQDPNQSEVNRNALVANVIPDYLGINSTIVTTNKPESYMIEKHVQKKEPSDKVYIVRVPLKVGESGDAASSSHVESKTESGEKNHANEGSNSVVDEDGGTEKEAALNLLTLAHQNI